MIIYFGVFLSLNAASYSNGLKFLVLCVRIFRLLISVCCAFFSLHFSWSVFFTFSRFVRRIVVTLADFIQFDFAVLLIESAVDYKFSIAYFFFVAVFCAFKNVPNAKLFLNFPESENVSVIVHMRVGWCESHDKNSSNGLV